MKKAEFEGYWLRRVRRLEDLLNFCFTAERKKG